MAGKIVMRALLSLAVLSAVAWPIDAAGPGDWLPFQSSGPTGSRPSLLPWTDATPGQPDMLQRMGRGARQWIYGASYWVKSGARTFAHRGWSPFWKRSEPAMASVAVEEDDATFMGRWFGQSEEPAREPKALTKWMRREAPNVE